MVENIVVILLCGSSEGNWDSYLIAIISLIQRRFVYDKVNYARYLTVYSAEMLALPENRPDVYQAYSAGWFSVQLSGLNSFGRIPVHQVTDVIVNKEACVKRNK